MKTPKGYTLVETLLAAAVLLVGIAAAATLAMTMTAYEEANASISRSLNYQEQAGRLFQLGLSPDEIQAILPEESTVSSLTFTSTNLALTNIGTVEKADCQMIFSAGPPLTAADQSSAAVRTNNIVLVRPSIR